jgi:hypothetical protein
MTPNRTAGGEKWYDKTVEEWGDGIVIASSSHNQHHLVIILSVYGDVLFFLLFNIE